MAAAKAQDAHVCPQCGQDLLRVHRHLGDRVVCMLRQVHRYRCDNPDCGWEGIVSLPIVGMAGRAGDTPGAVAAAWFLLGSVCAVLAVEGVRWMLRQPDAPPPPARVERAPPPVPVPLGESYDGEPLASDDPVVIANPTMLTIRRGCAWGVPGRNPYRGTVAEALQAARLPEEVVRKISAMVAQRLVSDYVQISNVGIWTLSHRRRFDPKALHMAFGTTLCLNTRVNFAPGHVERADLYEATDAEGRPYVIMVPYVCGNVTVLEEREERRNGGTDGRSVPEPGTLALFFAGLVAAGWAARRVWLGPGRRG